MTETLIITAALGYLLGSIPFGYLLVSLFRGQDIRESGSGNIGATNVSRTSPLLGAVTLLLDAFKGAAAVALVQAIFHRDVTLLALTGFCAVVGHVFPVWLRWRGGKGVATGVGSWLIIAPKAALLAVAVFVVVLLLFRYVSAASIIAVAILPVLTWWLYANPPAARLLVAATAILIIAKHHGNIERLLAGTENRLAWGRR